MTDYPSRGDTPWDVSLKAYLDDAIETRVATVISTDGTDASDAIDARVAAGIGAETTARTAAVLAVRKRTATDKPRIVSILSGQADQVPTSTASCTVAGDTVHKMVGNQGMEITIPASGASTPSVTFDPIYPDSDPLAFPPADQVFFAIEIKDGEDPATITGFDFEIYGDAALSSDHKWTRSLSNAAVPLSAGKNIFRWKATDGNLLGWGTAYRTRVAIQQSAGPHHPVVGHAWVHCPDKGVTTLTFDAAMQTGIDYMLPRLRAMGANVVWALDPLKLGTGTGKNILATLSQIHDFYEAGDEINIHGWNGALTSAMTADQLFAEAMQIIRWFQQQGFPVPLLRSCFLQNNAPQHAIVQSLFPLGYGSPIGTTGSECWPPIRPFNIGRFPLHGSEAGQAARLTAHRATQQTTNCWNNDYMHGVHSDGITNGGADLTPAGADLILSLWEAGVADGTMEFATNEQLIARGGLTFQQGLGRPRAQYVGADGIPLLQELM